MSPIFCLAWPAALTGVMGGESAAGTMETVALASAKRRGVEPDMEALAKQRAAIVEIFNSQEDAFYTSGRMLDNGIIDPRDTRNVLAFCWAQYGSASTAPATQCLWRWAHVIRFAEREP